MSKEIAVPDGLHAAGARLWRSILGEYDLDEHESLLLIEAARVADRLDRLATESDGAPLTVLNFKGDSVANPLLTEARAQGIVLARLLAALRLPSGEKEGGSRPQRRGIRGVYQPRRLYGSGNAG
jgi:hypothetical protein